MADINLGWLTGFDDVKFAPKTLFSQILNDDNGMTLKDYFFNIINLNKLQVNLASDEAGTFSAEKEDSNTASLIGVTGTLDVGNGGIGVANPTANALLVGNGANPVTLLGLPSDGTKQFLISTSAGPAYSKLYGSWTQGDASNGPNLNLGFTSDASDYKGISGAIPVATATVSGVMSATAQGFGGLKTFVDGITVLETTTLSNLVIDGSSANIDMGGNAIAGVASPTDGAHAANKTYVDNIQTALSKSISDLSDIVGGTSGSNSHHVRLSALEADNTSNIARLDKLDTYFGGYDETTKAFYILDGSSENTDDCNVVAYFDADGLHVTELLVGTDKYTDQISNLQKQDAAIDQSLQTINGLLGTDNALGTIFQQLSDLRADYTTENGERIAADEVHSSKLDALEGIVGGALSDGITHQASLQTIFNILGVSEVPAEGNHNTQLTTLKSSLETAITDLNAAIDTAKADIRDDTLVVDFATSGAQAISSGKIGIQGTLAVGDGGTGATTFTANGILLGNGTSALKQVTTSTGLLIKNANGVPEFGGRLYCGWTNGTTAGPTLTYSLKLGDTENDSYSDTVAIPSATETQSGVVIVGSQTFGGAKTFSGDVSMSSTLTVGSQLTVNSASRFNGTVYFESYIGSSLVPSSSYTMLLGNTGNPWGSVYAKEVILKDASGIGYIKSSTATSTITVQDASMDMTSPILYLNGQKIVLNSNNYGSSLPTEGMVEGQVFFLLTS